MKLSICALLVCHSFFSLAQAGAWTQRANFPGPKRQNAVAFSIGNKGYIATGDTVGSNSYLKDLWEWDQANNTWTKKADMPASAPARSGAVGFSIGNKGYIATGGGTALFAYGDLWEWDQGTNTWMQKADLPANGRAYAVGFSIGSKGYVGTGLRDNGLLLNDFWEWDQATDKWKPMDSIPNARKHAIGLSMGTKGYVGMGDTIGMQMVDDFWEWDQLSNIWIQKKNYPMGIRGSAGFVISNKIYVGTGDKNAMPSDSFFFWDSISNKWSTIAPFGGGSTKWACSFSIGNFGYVLPKSFTGEFWEYSPFVNISENVDKQRMFNLYPNPVQENLYVSFEHGYNEVHTYMFSIFNVYGQKIETRKIKNHEISVFTLNYLSGGIYFYKIEDDNSDTLVKGKFILTQ